LAQSLGSALLDLDVDKTKLSAGMSGAKQEVDATFRSLGQKTKDMGAKLTQTVTPIAAALGLALREAGRQWNEGVNAIRVGTGATGVELDKLVDSMKRVGGKVTQPLGEVGRVMSDLATRTGLTGKPLEELTTNVLNLARATGGDAQASVAGITRLFGDWSIKTTQMTPTLDKLFRVSQSTGIGVQQLSELMVAFGSPLRNLGLDFDTSAAMFAKFEQEGVNIQTVMPGLKMALGNFAKAGRDPAEALQETFLAMQNAGSGAELMQIAYDNFGQRAAPDLAAAVREGRFEFDELIDTMNNGSDTIQSAADDTLTMSGRFAMFRNKVTAAIGPFAEWGAVVMGVVAAVGPALFGLGIIMDTTVGKVIGGWIKSAASAVAATVKTIAQIAIQVAKWAWMGVQALLHAAKVAAAWLIAMGPIALVVVAVLGLVALIVLNFDKIKEFIGKAWEWIKDKTSQVWDAIKGFFAEWWPQLLAISTAGISLIVAWIIDNWDKIKEKTKEIWNGIKEFISNTWERIKEKTKEIWNGIKEFFSNAWERIKEIATNAGDAIKSALAAAWEWIRNQITQTVNVWKNLFSNAWDAIKNGVKNAWERIKEGVKNGATNVVNFIKELPGRIVSALGDLGSRLLEAGKALMRGLLNGIKAGLEAVWETVKGIGGKIASLKGPLPKDLQLLVPAGRALMKGLRGGIEVGFNAEVAPLLAGITATIADGGASSRTNNIAIHGVPITSMNEQTLADTLRRMEVLGGFAV
jgi:TP901 family phage tail tape measure protein